MSEPAAWGVLRVGGSWVSILASEVQAETSRKSFDKMENWVHEVVPLYRSPTLTDAELEAINMSRRILVSEPSMNPAQRAEWAITLSRLLDRTGFAK